MVLMTQAKVSKIQENIFENRFMHVPELKRMGAKIKLKIILLLLKDQQNYLEQKLWQQI